MKVNSESTIKSDAATTIIVKNRDGETMLCCQGLEVYFGHIGLHLELLSL